MELDYAALGFRCGLEIHQQVEGSKLFCRCPTDAPRELDDEHPDFHFVRRLRPTQSEMGEVDAAALAEARRDRWFEYRGFHKWSCLVDADEEPPHSADKGALDVALTMTLLFGGTPFDEVEWMRKIVIDGSNTSGFQRTGLVSRGGRVLDVDVQTVCLEEDSCRRIKDASDRVIFGLDRLGVPLVEIATDPQIRDGAHARQVAARIGALLRSTGKVRRGLGTIRQDLNVSIRGAPRVEVKGVQDLAAIAPVIEWEVRRQLRLLEVAKTLKERGTTLQSLTAAFVDCTSAFAHTGAGFVKKTLDAGGRVLGQRLPGFHGLIGAAKKEDPRLGRELAGYAKRDGGVSGILHSDELPGMGITPQEVDAVKALLNVGAQDGFVLVVEKQAKAESALRIVLQRAQRALDGVLPEVRMAEPDRTTSYLRPMPGAARMYPETDVPPNAVTADHLYRLRQELPRTPEEEAQRLVATFRLPLEEANQIVADGIVREFEDLVKVAEPTLASRVLLSYLPELERAHGATADRHYAWAKEVLQAVRAGRFAKEGVPTVLTVLASGQAADVATAVAKAGLGGVDLSLVRDRARGLVQERLAFVKERGAASVQPLMGLLMKEFRGKVDGAELNRVLLAEVENALRN